MARLCYILLALIALMAASCGHGRVDDPAGTSRSVYYWRTVFSLDSAEQAFLTQHEVERMYVRYFDVVMEHGQAMPNATIKWDQPAPQGIEIVPTIFIVENCLDHMAEHSQQLVDRIIKMNKTHDIAGVKEVQIDCDWTQRSQETYFKLLSNLRKAFKEHSIELSATIRLHQLSMTPPPVDRGVLMMYNTGSLTATNGHNPILDKRDVAPYLKRLAGYRLPLAVAWPCYSWNLLYTGNQFKAILYNANLADSSTYRQASAGRYVVMRNSVIPEPNSDGSDMQWAHVGDSVVTTMPTAQQVLDIVDATERERPGLNNNAIIYSLDSKNFLNYDSKYFEALLRR